MVLGTKKLADLKCLHFKNCLENLQFSKYPPPLAIPRLCNTNVSTSIHLLKYEHQFLEHSQQLVFQSVLMCSSAELTLQHADGSSNCSSGQAHKETTTAKQTLSKLVFKQCFQPWFIFFKVAVQEALCKTRIKVFIYFRL